MGGRVGVIGSGISGLCVAYRLRQYCVDATVYEKSDRVGGNIATETRDNFLFEHGPNSCLASRELVDLIADLGLSFEIAIPNAAAKDRYTVRGGRLVKLPSSVAGLLTTPAFSRKAKLRLLAEPFVSRGSFADESVAAFFERRLGREIVDYAVDPFISGIYAGDPKLLSIRHAFPKIYALEARFGSLIKGALLSKNEKAGRLPKKTPRSITFKRGMQALPEALAGRLGSAVRLGEKVTAIRKSAAGKYIVETADGDETFDSIVVAAPAKAASELIAELDADLSAELKNVYYPPVTVVVTAFEAARVGVEPAGFGFLVPGVERRQILGSLWTSSVFENRAPAGYHIFTTFIGGSRNAALCEKTDAELAAIAADELSQLLQTTGEPIFAVVKKWERAIPQYNLGYEKIVEAIEAAQNKNKGLFVCSNFYKGISIGDCVKNGIAAADEIREFLKYLL